MRRTRSSTWALFTAVLFKLALLLLAAVLSVNLLAFVGFEQALDHNIINYAPEVWLSLLALVFGTLIIVISIASGTTPKLIDLFVGDYKSRLYIWVIALSSLENILLQLTESAQTTFLANLIFLNCYILLPGMVLLAIPYAFYILKYTRITDVIKNIYHKNYLAIQRAGSVNVNASEIKYIHEALFGTMNQLHDLLQYIQFKEPKSEIIDRIGKSLRFYLSRKKRFPNSFFKLSASVKNDISFKTLQGKYDVIEAERIFYEQKVLRVLGNSYLLLIRDAHYDLASLCGSELFEVGKAASEVGDQEVVEAVILHFNTLLRYGINHGLKTKENRNVYNMMFQYSRLIHYFIESGQVERVANCARFFSFYGNEVHKMTSSEPFLAFLVDAFATELEKLVEAVYGNDFPREMQRELVAIFNKLILTASGSMTNSDNGRITQIALCLFYTANDEQEFMRLTVQFLLEGLHGCDQEGKVELVMKTCERLKKEDAEFWEETDQGNTNIFYSPNKDQLPAFMDYFLNEVNTNNLLSVKK